MTDAIGDMLHLAAGDRIVLDVPHRGGGRERTIFRRRDLAIDRLGGDWRVRQERRPPGFRLYLEPDAPA